MVVFSIKRVDGDGFLYETTTNRKNDDLINSLVSIHNLRVKSTIIIDAVRGLALYGPMKQQPDQLGCRDEFQEEYQNVTIEKGSHYKPDPSGIRTGNGPGPEYSTTLDNVANELSDYIHKSQVQRRVALTEEEIRNKVLDVKGAIMMAYPMGLPDWDVIKIIMDSIEGLVDEPYKSDAILDPSTTSLWAMGQEFQRGTIISSRLGKNEKTKVICKLQKSTDGAPSREPIVSEDERNAMMAYHFKRQEELKKLSESEEDDYLNSPWADPKGMKKNFYGLEKVRAPGIRLD